MEEGEADAINTQESCPSCGRDGGCNCQADPHVQNYQVLRTPVETWEGPREKWEYEEVPAHFLKGRLFRLWVKKCFSTETDDDGFVVLRVGLYSGSATVVVDLPNSFGYRDQLTYLYNEEALEMELGVGVGYDTCFLHTVSRGKQVLGVRVYPDGELGFWAEDYLRITRENFLEPEECIPSLWELAEVDETMANFCAEVETSYRLLDSIWEEPSMVCKKTRELVRKLSHSRERLCGFAEALRPAKNRFVSFVLKGLDDFSSSFMRSLETAPELGDDPIISVVAKRDPTLWWGQPILGC
jgi:hypothetical protein